MIVTPAAATATATYSSAASIDPASIALPRTSQVDVTRFVVEAFARS